MRIMSVKPQEPFSGDIVPEDKGSEEATEQVIAASRANYAKKYETNNEQAVNRAKGEQLTSAKRVHSGKPHDG